MIKNNKKCLSDILSVLLLIFIMVTSLVGFEIFYKFYFSNVQSKFEVNADVGRLIIKDVFSGSDKTSISLKNEKANYMIIKKVIINKKKCNIIGSNIIESQSTLNIYVDCIFNREEVVKVLVVTNFGLFDKALVTR